ncbi:MAG: PIG-L family deacetylase [Candidatus Aenigmarchaeota archaeon]|nr:PIG-L family deacetylase [Candidatus Aenigmarchaeota archaeon]
MRKTILALVAHNDDQVIGAGGTLAKYAKMGKKVRTIIFSFGEGSHPHLKREVIVRARVQESLKADKIMGGNGIAYLGLKEGHFYEEFKSKKTLKKILDIVKEENPELILTHSLDDPHPDHQAVYNLVYDLWKRKKIQCDVFSFEIWNPLRIRKRNVPKLIVDISDTFETKIKAVMAHKSQKVAIGALFWNIWLKAKWYGLKTGYKYAEIFHRIY